MSTRPGLTLGQDYDNPSEISAYPVALVGRVPVMELDGGYVFESAAICLHLGDLYPDAGLLGAPGTYARALAYQWSIFAPSELEPPLIEGVIEGAPLVAKQLLGAGRQFVFGEQSRVRLPQLALLSGAILSYLGATAPAVRPGPRSTPTSTTILSV